MSVIDEVYFNGVKMDEVYVDGLEVIPYSGEYLTNGRYFPLSNTAVDPVGTYFEGDYTFVPNDGLYFTTAPTNFDKLFMDGVGIVNSRVNDPDIGLWDVGRITSIYSIFAETEFNQDISNWDVSNINNMQNAFRRCPFNQDISSWNVSNVDNMSAILYQNYSFNQDLSSWCVTNITTEPFGFGTSVYTLPKPVWGTCPNG